MKTRQLCKCGCKKPVTKRQNGKWNKFIIGHNLKKPLTKKQEQKRRKNISTSMIILFQNHPEEKELRRIKAVGRKHSEESKQKMSVAAKKREEQKRKNGYVYPEEARRKISEAHKERIFSQETLKKISESNKGKIRLPELRKRISKALKKYYKTHENPFKGKNHTTKSKHKISNSLKGKYKGKLASNWQGGITSLPYGEEWTKWLKQEIKRRDKNKCQNPKCKAKSKILCIHHIDYDKQNSNPRNLITLCQKCHAKTFHHKKYWEEFYQNLILKSLKKFS